MTRPRHPARVIRIPSLNSASHADEQAHGLLIAIDRYAATFDLMLEAWRQQQHATAVNELRSNVLRKIH